MARDPPTGWVPRPCPFKTRLLPQAAKARTLQKIDLCRGSLAFASQSHPNVLKQDCAIEGFCEEFHGAGPHCLQTHFFVALRGDENRWNGAMVSIQPGLQIEAGHAGHADVGDQASGFVLPAGAQKLLGAREQLHSKARRLEQALQCQPIRLIVFDNRDYFRAHSRRHAGTILLRGNGGAIMACDRTADRNV